ncbi:MAG: DUF3185 family protein [Gammaproteobacteria bacterium]|nr:DUF3185 family protein [Gammaproteobacteria bacterium]
MARKKNTMNHISGIALLAVGGLLILWGYNESQSLGSQLNRVFSGNPTENTLYYYIGGGVCIVLGLINLGRK